MDAPRPPSTSVESTSSTIPSGLFYGPSTPSLSSLASSAGSARVSGDCRFDFGKHLGKTFAAVAREDASYCMWALNTSRPTKSLLHFVNFLRQQRAQLFGNTSAASPHSSPVSVRLPDVSAVRAYGRSGGLAGGTRSGCAPCPEGRMPSSFSSSEDPTGAQSNRSREFLPPVCPSTFSSFGLGARQPSFHEPPGRLAISDHFAFVGSCRAKAKDSGGVIDDREQAEGEDWDELLGLASSVIVSPTSSVGAPRPLGFSPGYSAGPSTASSPLTAAVSRELPSALANSHLPSLGPALPSNSQTVAPDISTGSASPGTCALGPFSPFLFCTGISKKGSTPLGGAFQTPQPSSPSDGEVGLTSPCSFTSVSLRVPSPENGETHGLRAEMAPSSASLLRQRRFHNLRECLPVAGQVPCRVAGEGGEARALICEADAPEPAEACGLVSSKIALEVSVALEVCSGTTFRVVAQRSVSSGGRKREGGTKASGGGWISRLPVELWIPLKALGPLPFREVSGMDSPSALFSAEKYDRVLNLLLQRFSLSDVRPIPPFVLRCFRAFMPFAPAVPLPRKTAHVLLGDKGDATDTAGLVSTAYPRLGGRGLQGAQQSEEREDIKARNPDAAELLENLKPFQVEGYLFGLKREGRLLIGDEMGLGKTLQALAIAAFYNREWPLLIVCPSSIRFQWRDQALRWLPRLLSAEHVCIVENGRTDIPEETRMVVISYDLITKQSKFHAPYQVVICDESHYLKNRQAKRTQVLCPLLRNAKRAILLSGTPALNKPVELYQQIDALLPDLCSYHEFADRYSVKVWNHFTRRFEHEGHQHAEELHVLLKKTIMIRRLKQQVHTELPPKIRSRVPVQIPVKELKEIRDKMEELSADGSAYKRDGADDDEDFLNGSAGSPLITELFTLTGLAKRQGVSEYLSYLFQGDPDLKLIVFGHHRAVLDHVEEHLKTKEKKRYVRIDGSTSQDKRESLVKEFQTSRECQVAILSITACGHGLNLTAAGTVVFAELYWVPGQMIQAEDRSHRIGNEFGCVQIHYLIAEGTLDETVFRTLQRKWGVMTSTLDGQQQHLAMDSHGPRRFLPPGCPRLSEPSSEGPSGVSPVLNTSRTGRCSSNPGDAVGQKGQKRLDAFLRGTAKGKEGDRSDAMNADVAKELEINESGSEAGTPGGPGARKRRRV